MMARDSEVQPEYVREWSAGPVKYKQRSNGTVDMEYQYSKYAPSIPMGSTKLTGKKQKYSGWGLFGPPANAVKNLFGKQSAPRNVAPPRSVTPSRVTNPLETSSETAQPVTLDELLGLGIPTPTSGDMGLYTGEEVAPTDLSSLLRGFIGSSGGDGGMSAKEQFELEQAKASQRALNRYARSLQEMLNTGSYRTNQDQLLANLAQQYQASSPVVNASIDALRSQISGMQNPYENIQVQTAQASPQLQQLLESQGVSATPLQEFGAALQAQNQGQAAAFGNLAQQLASGFEQSRGTQLTGAESQRAALLSALENARNTYASQLESQAMQRRQGIEQLLLDAIAKGANPKKKRGKK